MTRTRAPWLLMAGLALMYSTAAHAQERQYRQLTLADGRVLRAEVITTESTGLRMRTPQGESLISFELLADMVPITAAEYADQTPDRLWLSIDGDIRGVAEVFFSIPALEMSRPGASKLPSTPAYDKLATCGPDIDCALSATRDADWLWLAFAKIEGEQLVLRGGASGARQVTTVSADPDNPYEVWKAAHAILGLQAPAEVPKGVVQAFPGGEDIKAPKVETDWTAARVNSASLVPLPGYPSLAQGDTGRFAMALGGGLASTALVAGALSQVRGPDGKSIDAGSLAAGTVVSYVVFSGLWSNVLGHATLKANGGGVAVLPARNGGQVTFSSRF